MHDFALLGGLLGASWAFWRPLGRLLDASSASKRRSRGLQEAQEAPKRPPRGPSKSMLFMLVKRLLGASEGSVPGSGSEPRGSQRRFQAPKRHPRRAQDVKKYPKRASKHPNVEKYHFFEFFFNGTHSQVVRLSLQRLKRERIQRSKNWKWPI